MCSLSEQKEQSRLLNVYSPRETKDLIMKYILVYFLDIIQINEKPFQSQALALGLPRPTVNMLKSFLRLFSSGHQVSRLRLSAMTQGTSG